MIPAAVKRQAAEQMPLGVGPFARNGASVAGSAAEDATDGRRWESGT
jgi:hypothetical protein